MLVKVYLSEIFSNSEIKENIESSIPNNIKMDIEKTKLTKVPTLISLLKYLGTNVINE